MSGDVVTVAAGRPGLAPAPGRRPWWTKRLPILVFGLLAAAVAAVGVLAPFVSPADPNALHLGRTLRPPSPLAWFGTDETGRDVLSRTLWGTQLSLVSAGAVLLIAVSIGIAAGAIAGYRGGLADQLLMRAADLFLAFPGLILAIAITASLGPSLRNAVVAVGIVWWPIYARLVRSRVLVVKENLYIEAARALGLAEARILFKHVLPQCWGIVISRVTVDVGYAILLTASLSFLGLGSQPPTPDWGSMIATSRPYFFSYWWTVTFPGLAMLAAVLVFGFLGDALYETFGLKGERQI